MARLGRHSYPNVNFDGWGTHWLHFRLGAYFVVNGKSIRTDVGKLPYTDGSRVHNHGGELSASWVFRFPANSTIRIQPQIAYYHADGGSKPNVSRYRALGTAHFELLP